MSVIDRLDDAQVLYESGRPTGALLSLLVATAATSRKRYPRPTGDREAFTRFVNDELVAITGSCCNIRFENLSIEYRGEMRPFQDLLYQFVRCELAHEGTIPADVVFVRDEGLLLKGGDTLVLNEVLLQGLANAILSAPENTGEALRPPAGLPEAPAVLPRLGGGGQVSAVLIPLPLNFRRPIIYDPTRPST